mgnify:CR=1 FL=1
MNWSQQVDAYCERLDPGFWAEPVNALTNAAFLIAAAIMAWRLRGIHLPLAWALVALLAAIGIGSFLFHTFATAWAGMSDVLPIVLFVLLYLFTATRDYLGLSPTLSALSVLAFLPVAALLTPLMANIPLYGVSSVYLPVPLLILVYALLLYRQPRLAMGLAFGAGLLILSLTFRGLDMPVCARLPLGTHFLWHILNAIMLGWMIELYRRHMLARGEEQR